MRAVKSLVLATILAIPMGFYAKPLWSQGYMLDQMIIDYRQLIMQSKDAHTTAIGHIMTGTIPNANLVSHFEALLITTRQTRVAFEHEARGGDSVDAIWEEEGRKDFAEILDRVEANIQIAIETINKVGPGAAGDVTLSALGCKECHDKYRR